MSTLKFRNDHLIVVLAGLLLTGQAGAQTFTNFTTIDDPLAVQDDLHGTFVQGIFSNVVVGYYYDNAGRHGFYHTLGTTNYTTLDDPIGLNNGSSDTGAYGISGTNIVGWYEDEKGYTGAYGFEYNLVTGTYSTLDDPAGLSEGESSTEATAINGNSIVGGDSNNGIPAGNYFGFLATPVPGESGQFSYSAFYIPIYGNGENYVTRPTGISGNLVVGTFEDTNGYNPGFVYNLSTSNFMILTNSAGAYIVPYGIDGSNVVGYFSDPNNNYNYSGFLYTIGSTNLTSFIEPAASANTYAQGISGNAIVGYYYDNRDIPHGFVVGTPTVMVSPPVISLFHLANQDYDLNGTNGVPKAAFAILSTTNLTLPLTQWTVVETNSFDANGDFTFTNAITPGTPQMFYIIKESP